MRRSTRHGLRATAMASAAVMFLPTAALASSPGAPGIGDPYFPDYGNGGYDVSNYDVAVKVDGDKLSGKTTITAKATQDLSRFNLDFVLHTDSVKVNGKTAKFTHSDTHELVVTPADPIKKGAKMTVDVTYADKPGSVQIGGFDPVYITQPDNGMLILGEPASAPWWIPGNDHPRDKATFDIKITVPKGWEALSSGILAGHDTTDAATDTWHWQVNQPTTGYLVPMVAGQYDVKKSTVDGKPTWTAIADETGAAGEAARADFARLDEVNSFLESQFGNYHFDSHGNTIVNTSVGFALETQTRPTFSPAFWASGASNISVVVHEQAHQWFGDNVSVHNWRDVVMNEGYATWAQWRWEEAQGDDTANEIMMSYYNAYPAESTFWQLKIGDPGPNDLFDIEVYRRGAMTVQALRNRIGNKNLLDLFSQWESKHEYSDAAIKDFIALAEKISGEDLKGFFQHWYYDSKKPKATKENGLKGFNPADSTVMPSDIAAWDRLQQATAMLSAAEGGAR